MLGEISPKDAAEKVELYSVTCLQRERTAEMHLLFVANSLWDSEETGARRKKCSSTLLLSLQGKMHRWPPCLS